jgi:hypothetical protein
MTLAPNGEVNLLAAVLDDDSCARVMVLPPEAFVLMIVVEKPLLAFATNPVIVTFPVEVTKYTSATPGAQSF